MEEKQKGNEPVVERKGRLIGGGKSESTGQNSLSEQQKRIRKMRRYNRRHRKPLREPPVRIGHKIGPLPLSIVGTTRPDRIVRVGRKYPVNLYTTTIKYFYEDPKYQVKTTPRPQYRPSYGRRYDDREYGRRY